MNRIVAIAVFAFVLAIFAGRSVNADVQVRWSVELPARQPGWNHVRHMQQDGSYEPTYAGNTVFVGCSHNGAMIAYDAQSGDERWRFYTNAAIRTQAVADAKNVLFGSDDGYVYCLTHGGELRWKALVGLGDRFVIGHGNVVSAWPVPTRPLLKDGKLFILGGCWPADGVFMNAFDVATGKRLWRSTRMAMRSMRIPLFEKDGFVYVRTYSGTGGRAMRFDVNAGIASPWPKGMEYPRPAQVSVPGAQDVVGSNESNGLVFASSASGKFWCAGPNAKREAKHHERVLDQPAGDTVTAKAVLKAAGQSDGYALVAGLKDGALVEGLLRESDLYVVAVDSDAKKVDRIRRDLDRRGCFDDHRLAVIEMDLKHDVLPPYFASLIVTESGSTVSDTARYSLRPHGGAVVWSVNGKWRAEIRGELKGAGSWTHEYANASMTNSTPDTLVKAPLGILWYGGPGSDQKYYISGNRPTGALVMDGRMYLQGNGFIGTVDAFTGRLLWEVETPKMHIYNGTHSGGGTLSKSTPWSDPKADAKGIPNAQRARASGLNWAVASDCLYLFAGDKCLRFNPATGESLPTWEMPLPKVDGEQLCWGHPRIIEGIFVATAFRPSDMTAAKIGSGGNGGDWTGDRMPMSHVFGVDRRSGELLWSQPAAIAFNNRAFIATENRVFLSDMLQPDTIVNFKETGRKIPDAEPAIRAFDVETGKPVWHFQMKRLVKYLTYVAKEDILLVPNRYGRTLSEDGWGWPGIPASVTRRKSGRPNGVFRGFRGQTGEKLWEVSERHYDGPFTVIGDRVLNRYGTAFDPKTGLQALRESTITGELETFGFRKSGCAVLGACESVVAWRTAYHDVQARTSVRLDGFEAGCTTSLLPACGMLNMPNFGLFHLRARAAAVSLVHRPSAATWSTYQTTNPDNETPIRRLGYNFGAPGDRYDDDGTLWVRAVRGRRDIKIDVQPKEHTTIALGGNLDWIGQFGIEGASKITLATALNQRNKYKKQRFNIRLIFSNLIDTGVGERVFDVSLEGNVVINGFDLASVKESLVVREFKNVEVTGPLDIELTSKHGLATLSGVEIIAVD